MIELGDLFLLRPLWLALVPVALALAVLGARRADGMARWRTVIAPEFLPVLRRLGHITEAERDLAPWLMGAAGVAMALGLAGPATRNADAPALRNLDAVMILMDLSPSVTGGGGLADAQSAVSRLIDRHGTRPVALGVYSGESFLVSVPTEEPQTLQTAVAVADAGTMPVPGTRPDRALQMASASLAGVTAERADVILVSDGGGMGPLAREQARLLAASGARVSAVYVAPRDPPYGLPLPDREGLEVVVGAGGGVLVDVRDLDRLVRYLDRRSDVTPDDRGRQAVLFTDHGRWLAGLGLLALLPLFRRRLEA